MPGITPILIIPAAPVREVQEHMQEDHIILMGLKAMTDGL
jgi:hypothetical protein